LHRFISSIIVLFFIFFSHTPAPPYIYTLSLHDALPIYHQRSPRGVGLLLCRAAPARPWPRPAAPPADHCRQEDDLQLRHRRDHRDRKSTRLNSSHLVISYAVFCLKKKKKKQHSHIAACI